MNRLEGHENDHHNPPSPENTQIYRSQNNDLNKRINL